MDEHEEVQINYFKNEIEMRAESYEDDSASKLNIENTIKRIV